MKTRPLERWEVDKLAGALNQRDRLILLLGVCTGYRISEILWTTPADLTRGCLHIPADRTKNQVARNIPVPEPLLHAVLAYAGDKQTYERVFDISRSQYWRILKESASAIGIDTARLGTHSLRKTFATRVFDSQHSIDFCKMALGHRDIGSTLRYLEDDGRGGTAAVLDTIDFADLTKL